MDMPVSDINKRYSNTQLSLLPPEGEKHEWTANLWKTGSFSFEMRPNGDKWSRYNLLISLSQLDPKKGWFQRVPQKIMDKDPSIKEWDILKKNAYEFTDVDEASCIKVYYGVQQHGADLMTASQRNKYYGSKSNKIKYTCALQTEGGGYKLVMISYWADLMNPSLEQGNDINRSFADLHRRVQRSIKSLKISRKDYVRSINYRIVK